MPLPDTAGAFGLRRRPCIIPPLPATGTLPMSLETAPPEVKLAVDLIELLETNQLAPELVLAALAIVKSDYERKLAEGKDL